MKLIRIFILAVILGGCTKTIKYDLPYDDPKITLDARIVEGDSVYILTSLSHPIMDRGDQVLDTAFQVYLYEDGIMVEKLTPQFHGYYYGDWWWGNEQAYYIYYSEYRPKSGHTYRVESRRSGMLPAYGEQWIMPSLEITGSTFDTTSLGITARFIDDGNTQDFYRVRVFTGYHASINTQWFRTSDPTMEFFYEYSDDFDEQGLEKSGDVAFMSDEYFNGREKKIELNLEYIYGDKVILEISRLSEDLYKHERSKAAQWRSDGFFSEPSQIYGNVINGYGIVGAVSSSRIRIK